MYSSVISPAGTQQRREYYVCQRRNRRRDCQSTNVPRAACEQAIIQEIENHVLSLEFLLMVQQVQEQEHTSQLSKLGSELELVRSEAKASQRKLENLIRAITDRPNSPALLTALDALEIQTANLEARQAELEAQTAAAPVYSTETLNAMAEKIRASLQNENTRRETIRSLIHRVLVRREGHELKILAEFYSPQSVCVYKGALGWTHAVDIQITFKLYQRIKSI